MKKIVFLLLCLLTCTALLCSCSDRAAGETTTEDRNLAIEAPDNEEQIDGNYNEEDTELSVTDPDSSGESTTESSSDEEATTEAASSDTPVSNDKSPQENVATDPTIAYHGSGTFNGFADSHSIEVMLPDGSYQTFFVFEEELYDAFSKLAEQSEPPFIQFVYTGRDGQTIPEIIELN